MWHKKKKWINWVRTLFSASCGAHLLFTSDGPDYSVYNVVVGGSPVLRTTSLLRSQPKSVPIIHLGRKEQVRVKYQQHPGAHGVRTHDLGIMSPEY